MSMKKYDIIKDEDLIQFIQENFGKIRGTLSCDNPHWWLYFEETYIAYEYQCCEAEDCNSQDYEKYADPEELIREQIASLKGVGDWWWSPAIKDE